MLETYLMDGLAGIGEAHGLPPGRRGVVASLDGLIYAGTDADHDLYGQIQTDSGIRALAVHPSRLIVATGHEDGSLRLYDLRSRTLLASTPLGDRPLQVRFSPDGSRLAVAAGGVHVLRVDITR